MGLPGVLAKTRHMLLHICAKIFTMAIKQKTIAMWKVRKNILNLLNVVFLDTHFPSVGKVSVNPSGIESMGYLELLRTHTVLRGVLCMARELTDFVDIPVGWSRVVDLCIRGISPRWRLHLHIAALRALRQECRRVFNGGVGVFRAA